MPPSSDARSTAKSILSAVGLLPTAQRIVRKFRPPTEFEAYERRFHRLARRHGHVLGERLNDSHTTQKIALVCSPGFPEVEIELAFIKALQLANFLPVVLIPHDGPYAKLLAEHYRLAAVDEVHLWGEFVGELESDIANEVVSRYESVQDLLEFEHAGVRVGKLAVSTGLRTGYRGSLDLHVPEDRQVLVNAVGKSLQYVTAAQKMIQQFRPDLALFVDTVYSPIGELFDSCLQGNVDAVQWQQAHKSNHLLFRRYSLSTSSEHPRSLSDETWRLVREMPWTEDHRKRLDQELYSNYVSGDWFSVGGQPFNRSVTDSDSLRARLRLDPTKKTAFIFPHVLWDATLFWGKCLFRNYEEWFVETVRSACANDHVNWVIKVHPGNRRMREAGTLQIEPGETVSLRKHIGELPPHILTIPPESQISTYSLFPIMDYCLTVRGTVGMEAARLGIPALTGGNGPYHNRGFTIDSNSRQEYCEKVRNIHMIPRLSPLQQELADRFAYATFLMRPWRSESITLQYLPNAKKFMSKGEVNIRSKEDWYRAEDLRSFAEWVSDPGQTGEFLAHLPQPLQVANEVAS